MKENKDSKIKINVYYIVEPVGFRKQYTYYSDNPEIDKLIKDIVGLFCIFEPIDDKIEKKILELYPNASIEFIDDTGLGSI